jgi:ribosomal protein S18 acetylase RimI-like enzyme
VEAARPATPADVPTLVTLARALRAELRELRGGVLWETREAAPEPLDAVFAELLTRGDACVIAGTIDGVTVGYGAVGVETLRDGTRLGVIRELFVEPEARAVGVGEAIAEQLVGFCTQQGCQGIDATALPGHRAAKNFFERAGFTARALTMHHRL